MKLSPDVGAPLVKAFESCLAKVPGRPGYFRPYRCPAGVLTIGWGHTNHHEPKFAANEIWSQAKCDAVFLQDMQLFERHVLKNLRNTPVTQHQFDALVSWAYNTGGPPSAAVWSAARRGDVNATCAQLMRWTRGGGKVLNGLVRRRKAECALYRGQITEALRIAGTRRAPVKTAVAAATTAGAAVAAPAAVNAAGGPSWVLWAVGAVIIAAAVAGIVYLVVERRKHQPTGKATAPAGEAWEGAPDARQG